MDNDVALLDDVAPESMSDVTNPASAALFRDLVQSVDGDPEADVGRSRPFLGIAVGLLLSGLLWTGIGVAIWYIA